MTEHEGVVAGDMAGVVAGDTAGMVGSVDPATTALWSYAVREGWAWAFRPDGGWSGRTTGSVAGATYVPPDDCSSGWLECHDADRTVTATGVAEHAEAAAQVRSFFGWPAENPPAAVTRLRTHLMA